MKAMFAVLLVALPAATMGAIAFGDPDSTKFCAEHPLDPLNPKHKFPVPDDCTAYYSCKEFFTAKATCKTGMHFSFEDQKCTTPCEAKCDASVECPTFPAFGAFPFAAPPAGVPAGPGAAPGADPAVPEADPAAAPAAAPAAPAVSATPGKPAPSFWASMFGGFGNVPAGAAAGPSDGATDVDVDAVDA